MKKRMQQVCVQVCTAELCSVSPRVKRKIRIAYGSLIGVAMLAGIIVVAIAEVQLKRLEDAAKRSEAPPFPVSVVPNQKLIVENPDVDIYFAVHISTRNSNKSRLSWLENVMNAIAQSKWFQQIASPIARVAVIQPGERKEEIAENIGDLLNWDEAERAELMELIDTTPPRLNDGKYFPDRYLTHKDATPEEMATLINEQFDVEVLTRYPKEIAAQVPLEQALIIASLIEREAYDFTDAREISGIIWNRLFSEMNLQLDATLQYAKADGTHGVWWPRAVPDDKYIDSPFNTYEHEGLPPEPIANPSLDSLLAALNPIETDCLFYFHDEYSNFHCSPTYEGHVQLLRQFYGQGR